MRYSPYWPARIVSAPAALKRVPKKKICVFFLAQKISEYHPNFSCIFMFLIVWYFLYNSGFVDVQMIASYLQSRDKYIKRGKGKKFEDAVQKCDQFMKDPIVCVFDQL